MLLSSHVSRSSFKFRSGTDQQGYIPLGYNGNVAKATDMLKLTVIFHFKA